MILSIHLDYEQAECDLHPRGVKMKNGNPAVCLSGRNIYLWLSADQARSISASLISAADGAEELCNPFAKETP